MAQNTSEITALRDLQREKMQFENRSQRATELSADALEAIRQELHETNMMLGKILAALGARR